MTSSGSGRKIFISAGSSCHPSIIYFQYAVMFYFNSLIFNEVILFIRGKTCYLNCPFDFNPNRPGGERYPAYCTADLTRPTFMIQHLRSVNFFNIFQKCHAQFEHPSLTDTVPPDFYISSDANTSRTLLQQMLDTPPKKGKKSYY